MCRGRVRLLCHLYAVVGGKGRATLGPDAQSPNPRNEGTWFVHDDHTSLTPPSQEMIDTAASKLQHQM